MESRIRALRIIADYQFGKGAGKVLFPDDVELVISKATGKVRQIKHNGVRIATLKPDTGLFSLSIEGARRLKEAFEYPKLRVVVMNDVSEFVARGKNVFAKHVVDVDEEIRANDEVIIVNEDDELLATGRAKLSSFEMLAFDRGVAVEVRQGVRK